MPPHAVDAPSLDPQAFLLRVLRGMAILAIAYGALQAATVVAFAIAQGFPFDAWAWGGVPWVNRGLSLLRILAPVLLIVGGWGLLKWKPWGRKLLVAWSLLSMALGLAGAISVLIYLRREWGATTQPFGRPRALDVWFAIYGFLENCALPLAVLWMLRQTEVTRLWGRRPGRGGFDVIPMASAIDAADNGSATEISR